MDWKRTTPVSPANNGSIGAGKAAAGSHAFHGMASSTFCRSRQAAWLAIGIIAAAALAAYGNSFFGAFVFDDDKSITENQSLRHLSTALFPPIHGETVTGRPVLNATLAINYAVSGAQVWSYHVGNWMIHVAVALLLFGIVRRTFLLPAMRRRWRSSATPLAFIAALLWVVHPLTTESVTYVVQRAESLMGLFYLLTLYCVIRGARSIRSIPWYSAAFAACLLGMASKEVMASAPLIVLFYDRAFLAGSFREAWRRRYGLYLALASTWILLGWLILTGAVAAGIGVGVSWWAYFCTQFGAIVHYLRLCLWPSPLLFDYGGHLAEGFWEIVPYGIATVSLGLATAVALWRWPKVGFLGLCFFAILAPSSSVVPACASQTLAEHRMYLPLAAVVVCAVIVGFLAWEWFIRREMFPQQASRALAAGVAALAAVSLGILTFERNDDYRTAVSIWSDTIAKSPRNPRAHNNCGKALTEQGRIDEGAAYYRKALEIDPDYADAHNNLGTIYANRGQLDEAIAHFQKAVESADKRRQWVFAEAFNNLGAALAGRGQIDDAMHCYEKALQRDPNFAGAYCNLGVAFAARGRIAEALAHYQKALELNPSYAEAEYDLGNALATIGRLDEAIAFYRKALGHKSDHANAHHNLAVALAAKGQINEAVAHYYQAVAIQPGYTQAHHNLAIALTKQSRFGEAVVHYRKAVEIRPEVKACIGLAMLLAACPDASIRNGDEAVGLAERAKALGDGDPVVLDALAAAYAEAGRFTDAVQAARKALNLAKGQGNVALANVLSGRLELYEAGKPCRDVLTASTAAQQPRTTPGFGK